MSFKKKFLEYADKWEKEGIITHSQKLKMMEDVEGESATSTLFRLFAVIGSLFIGVGVILLISSNWDQLPKIVKLIFILLMPVASLGLGYYLSYVKEDYKKIGDAFIILGDLLIGASLALIGQLYNLGGSVASLLAWWLLLSIPVLFVFRYRLLSAISTILFYLTCLFYFIDNERFLRIFDDLLVFFTVLTLFVISIGFAIKKSGFLNKDFANIVDVVQFISVELLMFVLFFATIDDSLYFFGSSVISGVFQNALFLVTVFVVLWYSNKNYLYSLRNVSLIWIGVYMIAKYISWFWDYMSTGLFFVLFGLFLILLVYAYIKITKYLKNLKEEIKKEVYDEVNAYAKRKQ